MNKRQAGFSLIELMIAVVVIGILTAVALPSYNSYMTRARLTEAFTGLAGVQPKMEQHWSNTRSYAGAATLGLMPRNSANFSFALTQANASAYLVTATGQGAATGFAFTIDQNGNRATTRAPTGWTASNACWVDRKEGQCAE